MKLFACIREQKVYLCNPIPLPMAKKCAIEAGKNINVKRLESENLGMPKVQSVVSSNSELWEMSLTRWKYIACPIIL